VRLPAAIQASLGKQAAYPWMVDAETAYRWDFNLFVVIAAPLMVIAILMALTFGWRSADVWRHPAIAPLKRFGDPRQIVGSIDREIRDAGKPGCVGLLIVTASWVIVTKPYLLIFAASDLMGVGLQLTPGKSGGNTPPRPTVRVWRRGQVKPDRIDIRDPEVARAASEKIRACAPLGGGRRHRCFRAPVGSGSRGVRARCRRPKAVHLPRRDVAETCLISRLHLRVRREAPEPHGMCYTAIWLGVHE
jgi:hypothetical protein